MTPRVLDVEPRTHRLELLELEDSPAHRQLLEAWIGAAWISSSTARSPNMQDGPYTQSRRAESY
jgi:hypothetical protein